MALGPTVLLAALLGVVQGLTEFLPISSTGHLILAGALLGFTGEKAKVFEVVIQTGAMLAIVWEYRVRFLGILSGIANDRASQRFVVNLLVAFLPAAIIGLAVGGVVNFILDKKFTGFKANLQGGMSTYGDDGSVLMQMAAGTDFGGGRGHVEGSL